MLCIEGKVQNIWTMLEIISTMLQNDVIGKENKELFDKGILHLKGH